MENKVLYSILFLKGRNGLNVKELSTLLKVDKKEIEQKLLDLKIELEKLGSPLELKNVDEKIRLTVTKETSLKLSNVMDKTINISLTKSVLEALTIIAYKQPTTKSKIEHIRGVSADYAISKLIEYDLIESNERSDLPGKPRLYVTTNAFLELFDLNSLDELPKELDDFEEKTSEVTLFVYDSDNEKNEDNKEDKVYDSNEENIVEANDIVEDNNEETNTSNENQDDVSNEENIVKEYDNIVEDNNEENINEINSDIEKEDNE